jgi:hypothetical protein
VCVYFGVFFGVSPIGLLLSGTPHTASTLADALSALDSPSLLPLRTVGSYNCAGWWALCLQAARDDGGVLEGALVWAARAGVAAELFEPRGEALDWDAMRLQQSQDLPSQQYHQRHSPQSQHVQHHPQREQQQQQQQQHQQQQQQLQQSLSPDRSGMGGAAGTLGTSGCAADTLQGTEPLPSPRSLLVVSILGAPSPQSLVAVLDSLLEIARRSPADAVPEIVALTRVSDECPPRCIEAIVSIADTLALPATASVRATISTGDDVRVGDCAAGAPPTSTPPPPPPKKKVTVPDLMRLACQRLSRESPSVDFALTPLRSRMIAKRLVVLDLNYTLITGDLTQELGERHGVGKELRAVTARFESGEVQWRPIFFFFSL